MTEEISLDSTQELVSRLAQLSGIEQQVRDSDLNVGLQMLVKQMEGQLSKQQNMAGHLQKLSLHATRLGFKGSSGHDMVEFLDQILLGCAPTELRGLTRAIEAHDPELQKWANQTSHGKDAAKYLARCEASVLRSHAQIQAQKTTIAVLAKPLIPNGAMGANVLMDSEAGGQHVN